MEELKLEQEELQKKLIKLIKFINSEDYFKLEETEKSLLATQRLGMETYLNCLTQRIYGVNKMNYSSSLLPILMMSMFTPSFNSSLSDVAGKTE